MAPVSVMPRLGFWSSISPPGGRGGRRFFRLCLFCRYVQGVLRNDIDVAAMRKGFKEMWWHAKLCTRVLKRLFVAFARLAAMCKGFEGNVQLLPLCARVLWKCNAVCGYVRKF